MTVAGRAEPADSISDIHRQRHDEDISRNVDD